MSTIVPVLHRLLVKVKPEEKVTAAGIVIPESDEFKRRQKGKEVGEVVAIGPTAYISSSGEKLGSINIGDIVYFVRYAGTEIDNPSDKKSNYRIINDDDVLAFLVDGERNE